MKRCGDNKNVSPLGVLLNDNIYNSWMSKQVVYI